MPGAWKGALSVDTRSNAYTQRARWRRYSLAIAANSSTYPIFADRNCGLKIRTSSSPMNPRLAIVAMVT